MKLSAPMKVSEVAAKLGWSHRRTLRWLLEGHEASGGQLLKGGDRTPSGGTRPWTVTEAALFRVYPDAFQPPPGLESRLEEVEAKQREQGEQIHQTVTVVGIMRRRQAGKPRAMLRAAAA